MTTQSVDDRYDDLEVATTEADLRELAVLRLRERRDFRRLLTAFVVVNALLWALWCVGVLVWDLWLPWPLLPMFLWGVYLRQDLTEDDVQQELARLRH